MIPSLILLTLFGGTIVFTLWKFGTHISFRIKTVMTALVVIVLACLWLLLATYQKHPVKDQGSVVNSYIDSAYSHMKIADYYARHMEADKSVKQLDTVRKLTNIADSLNVFVLHSGDSHVNNRIWQLQFDLNGKETHYNSGLPERVLHDADSYLTPPHDIQ